MNRLGVFVLLAMIASMPIWIDIMGWILDKIFGKKTCKHEKNTYRNEYKHVPTGTPMIHFVCYECGYNDAGHVYADPDTYPVSRITEVRNGIKTVS